MEFGTLFLAMFLPYVVGNVNACGAGIMWLLMITINQLR